MGLLGNVADAYLTFQEPVEILSKVAVPFIFSTAVLKFSMAL